MLLQSIEIRYQIYSVYLLLLTLAHLVFIVKNQIKKNKTGGACQFNTTTGIPDENCYFLPDPDANVSR